MIAALLALCLQGTAVTPDQHLGRPLGADFQLPDWQEVSSYFLALDQASPRVQTREIGRSEEGRPWYLSILSSEANLGRLEELRALNRRIADPRGATRDELDSALARAKPFVFVSCAMHATECAGPQFAMAFAHQLANSEAEPWKSARENCVVLLAPSLNPDGLDHVVSWYRRVVGTPYEASELDRLYQYYAGHDNNRDWFALALAETRIVTKLLYEEWFPQIYWDVHQQGSRSERMFVPPFRDPLSPNLDAGVINSINLLGMRAVHDMTAEGLRGISWGVTYDMWWNGGNRNVPVRHNMVGLLTEAASARLASPIFLAPTELEAPGGLGSYAPSNQFPAPWPGGWWRVRDIIDYELAFGRSLLGSVAREPQLVLTNALNAAQRALARPSELGVRGWLIPSYNTNRGACERLCSILLRTGVELERCETAVQADGRSYPSGSILIRVPQPYAMHVKDLFDIQRYPAGEPPYDVAGWTLPELFGVEALAVVRQLEVTQTTPLRDAANCFGLSDAPWSSADANGWRRAVQEWKAGRAVTFSAESGGEFSSTSSRPSMTIKALPRIGVHAPHSGNMDEGWMRWMLDHFGLPFVTVRNEELRAGALSRHIDVLLLPGSSARDLERGRAAGSAPAELTGGLDPQGSQAIAEFVREGGKLIAVGSSCAYAIDLLQLPVVDVTTGDSAKDFACPGSVVRARTNLSRTTQGMDPEPAVFFSRSSAFRSMRDAERGAREGVMQALLSYAPNRVLVSGWIQKPEVIEGQGAWVRLNSGKGKVHLFGFRPQYRSWTEGSFLMLLRALLLEDTER